MKLYRFYLACLILALPAYLPAQAPDFEAFIKKFPVKKLPYQAVAKEKVKFSAAAQITQEEAATFLVGFENPNKQTVSHYSELIEPFPLTKNEEGMEIMAVGTAQRVALLQRTDQYILVLIRSKFETKNFEHISGEQYVLHTFTPSGEPLTAVPIAQKIQFDLHSNQVSSTIDAKGNIIAIVEVFAPSGNSKTEEKYRITESGLIEQIK